MFLNLFNRKIALTIKVIFKLHTNFTCLTCTCFGLSGAVFFMEAFIRVPCLFVSSGRNCQESRAGEGEKLSVSSQFSTSLWATPCDA